MCDGHRSAQGYDINSFGVKVHLEKGGRGVAGKHSIVPIAGIGEYLMVVPGLVLNPFPDEQIPPDEKDYSKNEDYVIILGHPI